MGLFNTQEEFDVSDAGLQPMTAAPATITAFEIVEKDNGTLHELTFEVEGLPFPISKGFWYKHNNPEAEKIGRGQLKRISRAATGSTRYTSESLIGAKVLVDVAEDDAGYAQLKKIRAVSNGR